MTPYPCFTEALVDIKALIAGQIIELCRVQKILYLHFGVDLLFLQFRSCLLNVLNESTECSDGFQIVTRFNQVRISFGRRKHFRMLRGDGPHFSSRIFRGYIVSEIFHRLWQAAQEFVCIEALNEHLCATLIHDGGCTSPPVAANEEFRMEIVNDIYKKLHDLDYFLLRYGAAGT